jgi:acyl-CoA synthetase (NDP forming)
MDVNSSDFDGFFNPGSIAIIGVSRKGSGFGGGTFLAKFIECGFPGKLYPINPKADEIQGLKAYPDLASLPETPDLALVSVAAKYVPAVLEECARNGVRNIHILSSGFKETAGVVGSDGVMLEERIAAIARENDLLIIGPNCMGPYCPSSRLTAWGAIPGMSGPVGVISQSGGITQRLTEYLCSLGIGVDKAVSIGNATVLDSPDYLEYMGAEDNIGVIAMYLESVKDGRRLFKLARNISRNIANKKPIVIWKGGESEAGARTVASHTGSLAGELKLWDAFFNQTGAARVRSMDEWVDALAAFSMLSPPRGKGVFLVGGGGGNSVGNGDACIAEGLDVPLPSRDTMDALRKMVPLAGSIAGNPLDEWRMYEDVEYLMEVLELGFADPAFDMIMLDRLIPRKAFHMTGDKDAAPALIDFIKRYNHRKPLVITADSEGGDEELAAKGSALRAQFSKAGIPAYPSSRRAARALAHLHRYHSHSAGDQKRD